MSTKDKLLAGLLLGLLTVGFLYVSTDEYNFECEMYGTEETETDWAEIESVEHEVDRLYTTPTETETEQKYIVRYGIAYDFGTVIVTEDGNEWCIQDAPELPYGQKVRVLFDSRETVEVDDDIIIDITERK